MTSCRPQQQKTSEERATLSKQRAKKISKDKGGSRKALRSTQRAKATLFILKFELDLNQFQQVKS